MKKKVIPLSPKSLSKIFNPTTYKASFRIYVKSNIKWVKHGKWLGIVYTVILTLKKDICIKNRTYSNHGFVKKLIVGKLSCDRTCYCLRLVNRKGWDSLLLITNELLLEIHEYSITKFYKSLRTVHVSLQLVS